MKTSLPDDIVPGKTYYWLNQKWHVRAVVDERVVSRTWSQEKQRWLYEVHDWSVFVVYVPRIRGE